MKMNMNNCPPVAAVRSDVITAQCQRHRYYGSSAQPLPSALQCSAVPRQTKQNKTKQTKRKKECGPTPVSSPKLHPSPTPDPTPDNPTIPCPSLPSPPTTGYILVDRQTHSPSNSLPLLPQSSQGSPSPCPSSPVRTHRSQAVSKALCQHRSPGNS
jgi:hypothetical protein